MILQAEFSVLRVTAMGDDKTVFTLPYLSLERFDMVEIVQSLEIFLHESGGVLKMYLTAIFT